MSQIISGSSSGNPAGTGGVQGDASYTGSGNTIPSDRDRVAGGTQQDQLNAGTQQGQANGTQQDQTNAATQQDQANVGTQQQAKATTQQDQANVGTQQANAATQQDQTNAATQQDQANVGTQQQANAATQQDQTNAGMQQDQPSANAQQDQQNADVQQFGRLPIDPDDANLRRYGTADTDYLRMLQDVGQAPTDDPNIPPAPGASYYASQTIEQLSAQVDKNRSMIAQQIRSDIPAPTSPDPWGPGGSTFSRALDYLANDCGLTLAHCVMPKNPGHDLLNIAAGSVGIVEGAATGNFVMYEKGADAYIQGVLDLPTSPLQFGAEHLAVAAGEHLAVAPGAAKAVGDLIVILPLEDPNSIPHTVEFANGLLGVGDVLLPNHP
jgi:hypothetical protein